MEFDVVLDHKALKSVLRANRGNKTFSSRLTRWVDRLPKFAFSAAHTPGRTLETAVNSEQVLFDWFTMNAVNEFGIALGGSVASKCEGAIKRERAANTQSKGEKSVRMKVTAVNEKIIHTVCQS